MSAMITPLADPIPLDGCFVPLEGWTAQAQMLLSPELQELLARLHRELEPERRELLLAREERQERWNRGECPGFLADDELPEARREWRIAPLPSDLMRRRVGIAGPLCDRRAVFDLFSRNADGVVADVALLDLEDSMKPSWSNVLQGLVNLVGAADGTLSCAGSAAAPFAPELQLDPSDRPLLVVRVRGLHLTESNVLVDGAAICAGLFDLVCAAYWSARTLLDHGRTPSYDLPKCEHHLEARWWNRLLERIEDELDLPPRTIKATALIETLPAAFQMEEILYQLRDHAAGLSVGRWDRIASDIKVLSRHPDRVLADRWTIDLDRPWLRNHALRLISVCHRHGAFALGGMPAGSTPGGADECRERLRAEHDLECALGHDGGWVAHPDDLGAALAAFPRDHQLEIVPPTPDRPELLPEDCGPRTLFGLRGNVRIAIAYLRGWNDGIGCVVWDDRREDLSSLEVARAQTWQWLHHRTVLEGGERVTLELVRGIFAEEQARIERELGERGADHHEIEAYRKARLDAETIFTERRLRPFLSMASDPAGLAGDLRRARLRGDALA